MKINAVSSDFPMKSMYSNISSQKEIVSKPKVRIFSDYKYGFNNESPDFFKLDKLKQTQMLYKNPYLENLVSEDRGSFLKSFNQTKHQIDAIDKLKCNRDWSQNPTHLKKITSSYDQDIITKRNKIKENKLVLPESYLVIDKEDNEALYNKKIKQLHYEYTPKHHFRVKNTFELNNTNTHENYKLPLTLKIDPSKSSYLKNYNDFKISESYKENEDRNIKFEKKDHQIFNCIIDKDVLVKPAKFPAIKWDTFHENYLLMLDKEKGLSKKGGLFTEFVNKNKKFMTSLKAQHLNLTKDSYNPLRTDEYSPSLSTKKKGYFSNTRKSDSSLEKVKNILEEKKLYKIQNYLVKTGALGK